KSFPTKGRETKTISHSGYCFDSDHKTGMVMATSPRALNRKTNMRLTLLTYRFYIKQGSKQDHCTSSFACTISYTCAPLQYRPIIHQWPHLNPLFVSVIHPALTDRPLCVQVKHWREGSPVSCDTPSRPKLKVGPQPTQVFQYSIRPPFGVSNLYIYP